MIPAASQLPSSTCVKSKTKPDTGNEQTEHFAVCSVYSLSLIQSMVFMFSLAYTIFSNRSTVLIDTGLFFQAGQIFLAWRLVKTCKKADRQHAPIFCDNKTQGGISISLLMKI